MPPLHSTKLIQELSGGAGLASQHLSLDPTRGPFPRLLAYPSGAVCHLTYPGAFTLYPSLCSCPHPASRSTFAQPMSFFCCRMQEIISGKNNAGHVWTSFTLLTLPGTFLQCRQFPEDSIPFSLPTGSRKTRRRSPITVIYVGAQEVHSWL